MFFDLFRSEGIDIALKWRLIPTKYPKNNDRNFGGKVILPQRVLEDLSNLGVPAPFTFEVSHSNRIYVSHCGVLEFTGKDEEIVVPEWLFQQLEMDQCGLLTVAYKKLIPGKSIELLPHSVDFLEIEDPKKELEKSLVHYQVLTQGDEILCNFKELGPIRFTVNQIHPRFDAIYIVDVDLIVEFLPPIGYEEKLQKEKTVQQFIECAADDAIDNDVPIRMKERGVCFDFTPHK
ncbi:Ubiquitin fusion-degradation protein [Pseudoloma neurophilia]|uniref:Ubiquitin fusion-degradation protein n=1 Tax=Pseudoloma neurophilia TaxID=146866 RepID=A0A0R0LRJ9_9MICR|nr:Ubiquitin fusion-degradation protein [Pseudoloma neurophilia]